LFSNIYLFLILVCRWMRYESNLRGLATCFSLTALFIMHLIVSSEFSGASALLHDLPLPTLTWLIGGNVLLPISPPKYRSLIDQTKTCQSQVQNWVLTDIIHMWQSYCLVQESWYLKFIAVTLLEIILTICNRFLHWMWIVLQTHLVVPSFNWSSWYSKPSTCHSQLLVLLHYIASIFRGYEICYQPIVYIDQNSFLTSKHMLQKGEIVACRPSSPFLQLPSPNSSLQWQSLEKTMIARAPPPPT
jgi:hypothetical protein